MDVTQVTADLVTEQQALDDVMVGLDAAQWDADTSSERWSVRDQIGHLTYFDGTAAEAIADPDGFAASRTALMATFGEPAEAIDTATLGDYRAMTASELLAAWRDNRTMLAQAAATLDNDTRVEWYGPSMGAKSFLTARLMEAWAHGQHICDAVGASRDATDRLRHIAQLGVITRRWTYKNRRAEMPDGDVIVTLSAPSGTTWTWGDETDGAGGTVSGPAEDFCLVVTQCRHIDDTDLTVTGAAARDWMEKAQAFAGGATDGPAPRP